ncbi:putative RNA-binding domain superfamily [Helianthus debilis subsp. tardiflorus]
MGASATKAREKEWSSGRGKQQGYIEVICVESPSEVLVTGSQGGFGRFEGSYIARKRDKWGKHFAFVSFSEVSDIKRLVEEISDIWIGSYKLFVTIARYVDGEQVQMPERDHVRKRTTVFQKAQPNPNSGEGEEGGGSLLTKGFNDIVTGNGRSFVDSILNRNIVDVIKVDDVVESFSIWDGVSLVGRVLDFNILSSLNMVLRRRCFFCDIKYLGGFTVALVFQDSNVVESFINDKDRWSTWFEYLVRWDGNVVVEEDRIAWLQVPGVLVQLALDQVYDSTGSRYGRVIKSACMSSDDNDFSVVYIRVLCKVHKRIADSVDISWRGRLFNVWADEDVGEWVPDCVVEPEEEVDDLVRPDEEKIDESVHIDVNMEP